MKEISIPFLSPSKVTPELNLRVDAMLKSLTAANVSAAEREIAISPGIPVKTQQRLKRRIKELFGLDAWAPAGDLVNHPQLRGAIESVLVRKPREDSNKILSAKALSILWTGGELLSIEEFAKATYVMPGANAISSYRALKALCASKRVLNEQSKPCELSDLPSERTYRRFLANWRDRNVSVRRARSRKNDWEKNQEAFVTRDVTQYRPGELWIGDHTELDFMVLNEEGKPDRRWITAFIDIRTSLIVGYNLNWQPCSQTISLAFRAAALGAQLKAFTGEAYEPVTSVNVPEVVMIDNGKDYRSNYTQRIFGKIDFEDAARTAVQRITRLHYTTKYHGQSKAQMERWFRTIQTMLKHLPGFKSNRYENKPDALKDDIKQKKLLLVSEFDALVARAIDAYNNRIHRSLKGQSPITCYLTNSTHERAIDLRVLDFLMMKVESKRIRRCQITLFGSEYYSDALMPFNDAQADVYYDPHDLGFVSLYVGGEFAAVACNKEMIGRDERGWQKILRDRKRNERSMQEEIKIHRRDIPNDFMRALLHQGEMMDIEAVPRELLAKRPQSVTLLTGLERDAAELDEKLEDHAQAVEIEKKAKKRGRSASVINLSNISNIS